MTVAKSIPMAQSSPWPPLPTPAQYSAAGPAPAPAAAIVRLPWRKRKPLPQRSMRVPLTCPLSCDDADQRLLAVQSNDLTFPDDGNTVAQQLDLFHVVDGVDDAHALIAVELHDAL